MPHTKTLHQLDFPGFESKQQGFTIYLTTSIPLQTYFNSQTHTIPSLRLKNECQLTHFPCSPALSTSCLFIEPHFPVLPQSDCINSLCSYLRHALCNPKNYVIKCKHASGPLPSLLYVFCLLFSFPSEFRVITRVSPAVTQWSFRA